MLFRKTSRDVPKTAERAWTHLKSLEQHCIQISIGEQASIMRVERRVILKDCSALPFIIINSSTFIHES